MLQYCLHSQYPAAQSIELSRDRFVSRPSSANTRYHEPTELLSAWYVGVLCSRPYIALTRTNTSYSTSSTSQTNWLGACKVIARLNINIRVLLNRKLSSTHARSLAVSAAMSLSHQSQATSTDNPNIDVEDRCSGLPADTSRIPTDGRTVGRSDGQLDDNPT